MTSPYLLVNFFILFRIFGQADECKFCGTKNVGVFFSPFVSVQDAVVENRYSSTDMLPLFSKISTDFRIIVATLGDFKQNDIAWEIPLQLAKWNAMESTQRPLEVFMYIMPADVEPLLRIRDMILEANKIYDKTITNILFFNTAEAINSNSIEGYLQTIREIFPTSKFSIGIDFSLNSFQDEVAKLNTQISKHIGNSFGLLDFAYISLGTDRSTTLNVKDYLKSKLDSAKEISKFIKSSSNHTTLSFGVTGGWPDTSQFGSVNYSSLVEYWELLAEYGKDKDLPILFLEAFDTFSWRTPQLCTTGWWRVVENASYTSTQDFVFEDKATLVKKEEITPYRMLTQIKENIQFHSENILVHFVPHASFFYPQYFKRGDKSNLKVFVEKLATKFSSISVVYKFEYPVTTKQLIELLPSVVAQQNRKLSSSRLKISITLDTQSSSEIYKMGTSILKANKIFPGTVKQVLLSIRANFEKEYLAAMRKRLNPDLVDPNIVKIGLHVDLNICRPQTYPLNTTNLKTLLDPVDSLFVTYFPGFSVPFSGHRYGQSRVFSQIVAVFESCKKRVAKIFPNKQVGFATTYYSPPDSVDEDLTNMVLFWKNMNKWASETNTQVILYNAFDSVDPRSDPETADATGWWRLRQSTDPNELPQFEDKRVVAIERLQKILIKKDSLDDKLEWKVGGILIAIFLLSTICIYLLITRYREAGKVEEIVNETVAFLEENCTEKLKFIPAVSFVPENSVVIGAGNFGTVFKCFMPEFQTDVAVKTATSSADGEHQFGVKSLLSEIKVMSGISRHENILNLLGICVDAPVFLVTEYCINGSLLSYLRKISLENETPSKYELIHFCAEIANGMWHLANCKIIHGDLSARNVLLNEDKVCKISDFGLSRKLESYEKYMKKGEEPLPWRWMAPESISMKEFSSKSDIWSMGVTFWEVLTLGKVPFPEFAWDEAFCEGLTKGLRLGKPEFGDENVYSIMQSCWKLEPGNRPSAQEILHQMRKAKHSEYYTIL